MDAYKINNRLYWTSGAIDALYDKCVDEETGEVPEDFAEILAALLAVDESAKDDAINEIKTRAAWNDTRRAEIARLRGEIDKDEARITMMKNALYKNLGGNKYTSAIGAVSYRHSKAVVISDEKALTGWAIASGRDIFLPPKAPEISKKAVADAINAGVLVPGADIVERVSVVVK